MKEEHIISLIESMPVARLSENELTAIRAHTVDCVNCRQAFEAAEISSLLLRARAAEAEETFALPPFFHTRVMARLREQQGADDSWANSWTLGRMWRAAGALASSMVATVAALAVLTFVVPGNQIASAPQINSLPNSYSAEAVLLDQGETLDEQASDGQMLTTIYGGEEEPVR
jgi:anti-sigma-K factor RskA